MAEEEKDATAENAEQDNEAESASEEPSALDEATRKLREQREDKTPFTILEDTLEPGAKRKIVAEIPREEWDKRIGGLFKELQQTASIEGFRKGKAPLKLLQRRFTKEVTDDVVEKIVPLVIRDYSEEKNHTVYGSPVVVEHTAEQDQPARITFIIEVKPEIEPSNYTGLDVEVPEFELTPEMVNERLEEIRRENAPYEEVDREFREGDAAVLDVKAVDARGQTTLQETNKLYMDLDEELPHAVAHELNGQKAGAAADVRGANPKNANEQWRYSVTLKSVKELRLPELDDEFAKDAGHSSLQDMRQAIEQQYRNQINSLYDEEAFERLMGKLIEAHQFDVPDALKSATESSMLKADVDFMSYTGMLPQRLRGKSRHQYFTDIAKSAEARVKGYLLIDAIGRKENLEASEDDINKALEERAQRENRKPLAIRAALERSREFDDFVQQVKYNKIRAFLLSQTKVQLVKPPPVTAAPEEPTAVPEENA